MTSFVISQPHRRVLVLFHCTAVYNNHRHPYVGHYVHIVPAFSIISIYILKDQFQLHVVILFGVC